MSRRASLEALRFGLDSARASEPTSSSSSAARSRRRAAALQPPTTRPSHQIVGPALPFRSNSSPVGAEVPLALLPAHRRRVERRQQRRPRLAAGSARGRRGAPAGPAAEIDLCRPDRGERAARLSRRAARSTIGWPSRLPGRTRSSHRAAARPGRSRAPSARAHRRATPRSAPIGTGRRSSVPAVARTRDRALGGEQGTAALRALALLCQRAVPSRSLLAESGSARVSSAVNASPRDLERREGDVEPLVDPASASAVTPAASTDRVESLPLAGRSTRVHASSITAARSSGTTKSVRRIPSIRTTERPSYSSRSRSRARSPRARPRREEHRDRIAGMQPDHRLRGVERGLAARPGPTGVARRPARAVPRPRSAPSLPSTSGALTSNTGGIRILTVCQCASAGWSARRGRAPS